MQVQGRRFIGAMKESACPSRPCPVAGRRGTPRKKALENIRDAISEYLAALEDRLQGEEVREVEVAI